jgi:hypothetical protein
LLEYIGSNRICQAKIAAIQEWEIVFGKPISIRKWWVAPEFKADGGFEPEEYTEYFEDSNPPPNAEIGCKTPFPDGN